MRSPRVLLVVTAFLLASLSAHAQGTGWGDFAYTSPTAPLQNNKICYSDGAFIRCDATSPDLTTYGLVDRITSGTTGMYATNNASATIVTGGVERVVVGTDGNIGIGRQPDVSYTLSVSGSTHFTSPARFGSSLTLTGAASFYPIFTDLGISTNRNLLIVMPSGSTGGIAAGFTDTRTPSNTLTLNGALRLSQDAQAGYNTCDANRIGTIRFTGTDFSVCRNVTIGWETLAQAATGGLEDRIISGTTQVITNNSTSITLATAGVERVVVGTNGSVGIAQQPVSGNALSISGTTAIAGRLDLVTNVADGNLIIGNAGGGTPTYTYTGIRHVFVGSNAGVSSTGGNDSVMIGNAAGRTNNGAQMVTIGSNAGTTNSGSLNVLTGFYAGNANNGSYNTMVGAYAGSSNVGNAVNAFGYQAAQSNSGTNVIGIGSQAAGSNTGNNVTAVGPSTARNNTGNGVTAYGAGAARYNTGGGIVGVGSGTAVSNTGNNLTAVGDNAANQNTAANVTALGFNAVGGVSNTFSNVTGLGYNAQPTKSNQIMLGDNNIVEVYSSGAGVFNRFIKPGAVSTSALPSAATSGAGAMMYDTTTNSMKYSNGSTWNEFDASTTNYKDRIISGTTQVIAYNNASATIATNGVERVVVGTNGNVAIGLQPTSYMLEVAGSTRTQTVQVKNPGTVAAPTFNWSGFPTSGLAFTNSGSLILASSGTEVLRAASNAKVGIGGVADPATALHVNGTLRIANGGEACDADRLGAIRYNANQFEICRNTTTGWESMVAGGNGTIQADRISSGTTSVITYNNTSATIATNGVERVVVGTNGNVGIGQQPDSGSALAVSGTGLFSGNVGVGVASPATRMHISGTLRIANGGETCDTDRLGAIRYNTNQFEICRNTTTGWESMVAGGNGTIQADRISSGTTSVITNNNASATIATNGVERVVVGTSGGVGIGQQPGTGNALSVSGTTNINGALSATNVSVTNNLTISNTLLAGSVGTGNLAASGYLSAGSIYTSGTVKVSNTVSADAFVGDGSGLKNVPTGDRIISGTTGMYATNNASATIATGGTTRLTVGTTGNVGINTGSPLTNLHVNGGMLAGTSSAEIPNNRAALTLAQATNNYLVMVNPAVNTSGFALANRDLIMANEGGPLRFVTGMTYNGDWSTTGQNRMIITNGGQVGIGVTTPTTLLHANGTLRIANGGEACDADRLGAIRYAGADFSICRNTTTGWETLAQAASGGLEDRIISGTTQVIANNSTSITLATGGVERVVVGTNGLVGIGQQPTAADALAVSGTIRATASIQVGGTASDPCTYPADLGRMRRNPSTGRMQFCVQVP